MKRCQVSVLFANFCLIYLIASAVYLIITRFYGTPFNNSLQNYPDLLRIKRESVEKRRNAFWFGVLVGIGFVFLAKPFNRCSN